MKTPVKIHNLLSQSAALSATLMASPVMAESNDTWKSIRDGWLSEYQLQPREERVRTKTVYNAASAANDAFASIYGGWLSEFESIDGSRMMASFNLFESAAYEGATRNNWLEMGGYRQ